MMAVTIQNTRAIVTGGANGIGNNYVRQLLHKGAKAVAILDVDVKNGDEAVRNFNNQFGQNRVVFFIADVSKPHQFEASFKEAVEHLGGLDIMINNAGILDDSRWNLMIDINVKGLIQGTLMAMDVMGKQKGGKGGTIINIGSIAGFLPGQYMPVYCATKHAVIGFSKSIALNFEQTGVSIKTMCPGAVDTFLVSNKAHRFLKFLDQEKGVEWFGSLTVQKPEIIAEAVIRLIEEAPNGAIWVNTLESPTMSLDIPEFTQWGTPV